MEDLGGGRRVFCIAKYKWGTTQTSLMWLLCNDPEEPPPIPNGVGSGNGCNGNGGSHHSLALFSGSWPGLGAWVPSAAINCCILLALCGCGNEADKRRRRLVYYTVKT